MLITKLIWLTAITEQKHSIKTNYSICACLQKTRKHVLHCMIKGVFKLWIPVNTYLNILGCYQESPLF